MWNMLTVFKACFTVSVVNFEQGNAIWVIFKYLRYFFKSASDNFIYKFFYWSFLEIFSHFHFSEINKLILFTQVKILPQKYQHIVLVSLLSFLSFMSSCRCNYQDLFGYSFCKTFWNASVVEFALSNFIDW